MLKEWYSAAELAGLPGMPGTKAGVIYRAKQGGWKSRPRAGRGGGLEYHLVILPDATRNELIRRIGKELLLSELLRIERLEADLRLQKSLLLGYMDIDP